MRAMILAAGRGERMGELTKNTPKPLLRIANQYLIENVIYGLKAAGISDIVINISYLAEQIKQALGEGRRYGVHIAYSEEEQRLETGGGIVKALPLLGSSPFIVVSADIMTDYRFDQLPADPSALAHLVLTDNPSFHPKGDFGLQQDHVSLTAQPRLTFANIAVYRPELFQTQQALYFPLSQLLFPAIEKSLVTGEYFQGKWHNIGTPEELSLVNQL